MYTGLTHNFNCQVGTVLYKMHKHITRLVGSYVCIAVLGCLASGAVNILLTKSIFERATVINYLGSALCTKKFGATFNTHAHKRPLEFKSDRRRAIVVSISNLDTVHI